MKRLAALALIVFTLMSPLSLWAEDAPPAGSTGGAGEDAGGDAANPDATTQDADAQGSQDGSSDAQDPQGGSGSLDPAVQDCMQACADVMTAVGLVMTMQNCACSDDSSGN